jgi:CheY-like chemotaxis protein
MNAHLLLVEDDPQTAFLVGVLAKRAGWALRTRACVDSAWQAVQERPPDLVLLDVNLPGESGLALLGRRTQPGGGVAWALFCQSGLRRDVAAGWRAGADYWLPKELVTQPAAWARRLGEILDHARGRSAPASLGWPVVEGELASSIWAETLNGVLGHPALRPLGAEVLDPVLGRALACGFGGPAPPSWLVEGAGRLAAANLPATAPAAAVCGCVTSLLDQAWRLLGREGCEGFDASLRSAVAGWAAG